MRIIAYDRFRPGVTMVDGQTVPEAKESFGVSIDAMLQSIHR
jgi:hypothetical protein